MAVFRHPISRTIATRLIIVALVILNCWIYNR